MTRLRLLLSGLNAFTIALVGCSTPEPAPRRAAPALRLPAPTPRARRRRRPPPPRARRVPLVVLPVAEGRQTVFAGAEDLNGIARSLLERHLRAGEQALARGRSSVALRHAEDVIEGARTVRGKTLELQRAARDLRRRARQVLGRRLHELSPAGP